jgi:Cu+-exporting ATPase
MRSDTEDVCRAIVLGKKTIRNIRQNLFWAFIYNVLAIPVAAGVLYPLGITLTPMIGGLAMSLSSLFVVGNALRLGRVKL